MLIFQRQALEEKRRCVFLGFVIIAIIIFFILAALADRYERPSWIRSNAEVITVDTLEELLLLAQQKDSTYWPYFIGVEKDKRHAFYTDGNVIIRHRIPFDLESDADTLLSVLVAARILDRGLDLIPPSQSPSQSDSASLFDPLHPEEIPYEDDESDDDGYNYWQMLHEDFHPPHRGGLDYEEELFYEEIGIFDPSSSYYEYHDEEEEFDDDEEEEDEEEFWDDDLDAYFFGEDDE